MTDQPTWSGPFHRRQIPRGIYGCCSKVREELTEAIDADEQGQELMLLVELADIVGAISGVVSIDGMTVADIVPRSAPSVPERPSTEILAQMDATLREAEAAELGGDRALLARKLGVVVLLCALIASVRNLDLEALVSFADLRSAVARHALGLEELN